MISTKPSVAFVGATGGCAVNALALALKDGYKVSALARTPQKLREMLEKEHAVPIATIDSNLIVVQGNSTDVAAVKQALAPRGVPAPLIISAVGGGPKFSGSLLTPLTLDQPSICEDTSSTIVNALKELRRGGVMSEAQKPTIIAISTTGLTKEKDLSTLFGPLYHVFLKVPHLDKKAMERNFVAAALESGTEAAVDSFVIVRPSLLLDGPTKGSSAVRVGWTKHEDAPTAAAGDAPGPAIGYTIRRVDVGTWIYENAIRNIIEWKGKCVTLTY